MEKDSTRKKQLQWIGMFMGPVLALFCLLSLPHEYQNPRSAETEPGNTSAQTASDTTEDASRTGQAQTEQATSEFSWAGRATLAVMVWMGVWWLTEAVHISVTALLPIVLFPLLGAAEIKEATFPYAHPLIFLYFGGFVIALSMERWGLGKRIALLTLQVIGTTAPRMIIGFMLVTAVLSAFVSNTATTAMMLPIALSVIALLRKQTLDKTVGGNEGELDNAADTSVNQFGTCLLLAVAYSASVGGIMTIIGTPPNTFLVGFLGDNIALEYRQEFSFVGWLPIGVSFAAVFLPIIFFMLTRIIFPIGNIQLSGGKKLISTELESLGKVHRGEWNTLIVFVLTVLLWLFRPLISGIEFNMGATPLRPFAALTDTGIAMTGAMLLFLLPVDAGQRLFTMDWKTTTKMPWGILILFGGGLSLAAAVRSNGVAEFIGSYAGQFGSLPTILSVLLVTTAIIFLTELTSNVATTTSLVPVLAALAPGIGIHPYLLIVPATIGASCAFMLPVATPPNAIVFGSGAITLPQMIRAGFWLNIIAIIIVTLHAFLVVRPWLGI